jgi:hypothetical protein
MISNPASDLREETLDPKLNKLSKSQQSELRMSQRIHEWLPYKHRTQHSIVGALSLMSDKLIEISANNK